MLVITGGAGFIGSNLVAALETSTQEPLIVIDRFYEDDRWQNLRSRNIADWIKPEQLTCFLNKNAGKIKAIFHMGAISTTTEINADLVMENNFKLSLYLMTWCIENQTRLIYASSAATYGDGINGFKDDESSAYLKRLLPLNVYAWSKHLFDRRITTLKESGFALPSQCVGLKFFNVYGPNEYHKGGQRSVAHALFEQIQTGQKARLFKATDPKYEDGCQLRDFVWVDDCVDLMLWLYQNPNISGLFNCGTGTARSFKDLALAIFKALGKESKIEYFDMPASLAPRYQNYTQASMEKIRKAGYTKKMTSLEEGIRRYVQDYLLKENRYR